MNDILESFRKELHQYPELSGREKETALRVKSFITKIHPPDEWIEGIGGHGIIAIYSFSEDGPVVMIRSELDALPIDETNRFTYQSKNVGVSHKCGHDGHMTMVAGLVFSIKKTTYTNGKIALLFQPSEENGKGALRVCEDQRFKNLKPDYIFALHNIPGLPLHSIFIVRSFFSATVQSFSIHLQGRESHAAEPDKGVNPALSVSKFISGLDLLNVTDPMSKVYTVLTPIHILLGSKDYGISPGNAKIHYTIRTWSVAHMNELKSKIESLIKDLCAKGSLSFDLNWFEYFPSAENDDELNDIIEEVAHFNNYNTQFEKHPFKFGEDFGWYSLGRRVAMFGLGAGEKTPALHHADYDFPDELLKTGIQMFNGIIETVLNKECLVSKE